ncbi:hypothetical protein DM860_004584 [Cuscuta australis]|uniref:Uncharacterized protein n=1 Tax=Cuscuta australis TaxID=267555 RepID=A0A328EC05_9ASTE|nr:hypothetical protein DM860_004584 [Cuscuta australis]
MSGRPPPSPNLFISGVSVAVYISASASFACFIAVSCANFAESSFPPTAASASASSSSSSSSSIQLPDVGTSSAIPPNLFISGVSVAVYISASASIACFIAVSCANFAESSFPFN